MTKKLPKCRNCKERFYPLNNNALQKFCMNHDECIKAKVEYDRELREKKAKREWNKKKREIKESLKTREDYFQEALKAFNAYIRERDKDKPCISCDKPAGKYRITSGHFYPQGTYRNIALDEDNAAGQCWWDCNKNKHGNLLEYRPRLEKRIGKERLEALDKRRLEVRKYTIPELIELKVIYKDKLKKLKEYG